MSQLFTSGGRSIGTSASASVLPKNIEGWSSLGLTGLISLLSKGLSRVFSSTTIWKHKLFSAQPFLWSNSHICTLSILNRKTIVLSILNNHRQKKKYEPTKRIFYIHTNKSQWAGRGECICNIIIFHIPWVGNPLIILQTFSQRSESSVFHIRLPNLGVLAWGEELPENLALKTSGFHHRSSTIVGKQRLHSWMAHTGFHMHWATGQSSGSIGVWAIDTCRSWKVSWEDGGEFWLTVGARTLVVKISAWALLSVLIFTPNFHTLPHLIAGRL